MNGDPSAHASFSLTSKLLVSDTLSPRGVQHHDRLNSVQNGPCHLELKERCLPNVLQQAINVCELNFANSIAGSQPLRDPNKPYQFSVLTRRVEEKAQELAEIFRNATRTGNTNDTPALKKQADILAAEQRDDLKYLAIQEGVSASDSETLSGVQTGLAKAYLELRASLNLVSKICNQTVQRNTKLLVELDPMLRIGSR